eukprot:Gb_05753 [translate_table: standard]
MVFGVISIYLITGLGCQEDSKRDRAMDSTFFDYSPSHLQQLYLLWQKNALPLSKSSMFPTILSDPLVDGLVISVNHIPLSNCARPRFELDLSTRKEGDFSITVEGKENSDNLGLGGQAKKLALKRLIELEKPEVIFVQESLSQRDLLLGELKKLLFGWDFLALDVDGFSGGLITGWSENINLINVFAMHSWLCTEVYCKGLCLTLTLLNGEIWDSSSRQDRIENFFLDKFDSVEWVDVEPIEGTSACAQFSLSLRRIKEKAMVWARNRGGIKVRGLKDLVASRVQHFNEIFKEPDRVDLGEIIQVTTYFPKMVGVEDNVMLYREITKEELRGPVKGLRRGFSLPVVKWIMGCVSSASFAVLINGSEFLGSHLAKWQLITSPKVPSLEGGQWFTDLTRCGCHHGLQSKYLPSKGFSTTSLIVKKMHLGQDSQSIGYKILEARTILLDKVGVLDFESFYCRGGILVVVQTLEGVEGFGTTLGVPGSMEERFIGRKLT